MACVHSCILLLVVTVAVALSLDTANAKPVTSAARPAAARGVYPLRRRFTARGCSSFGHSCFGGHGKRADDDFPPPDYPNTAADTELADKMPDSYKQQDIMPLLRQWLQLQAYRRLEEGNTN